MHAERRLQTTPELRELRLGHHRVALQQPERQQARGEQRHLLSENIAQYLYRRTVDIGVLHHVAVLVRCQLLQPGIGIGIYGWYRPYFYALGSEHGKSVRKEVFGIEDNGRLKRCMGETVVYVRVYGLHIEQRPARIVFEFARIYHPKRVGLDLIPLLPGGSLSRTVILSRKVAADRRQPDNS